MIVCIGVSTTFSILNVLSRIKEHSCFFYTEHHTCQWVCFWYCSRVSFTSKDCINNTSNKPMDQCGAGFVRKQACFCNAEQSLYICGPVYRNNPLVNTRTILGIRDHQSCPVELYLHFGSCYLKYFKCRSINVSSVTKGRLLFLLGNCWQRKHFPPFTF